MASTEQVNDTDNALNEYDNNNLYLMANDNDLSK